MTSRDQAEQSDQATPGPTGPGGLGGPGRADAPGRSDRTGGDRAGAARGRPRRAYHHGDLRNALVEAGTELVRAGGPEALVLREVARATGVSSTAAYRHFDNHGDLVEAVKDQATQMMAARVRAELDATTASPDPVDEALRRIAASGQGYVQFALAEPGLFRLIFRQSKRAGRTALALSAEEVSPLNEGDATYTMMAGALDTLVETGVLPAERRPMMDVALWASVHGIATLLIDTNLAQLPEPARDAAIRRTFDVVFHGIANGVTSPYTAPEA